MPDEKKGITVKIDAALHAQVREYVESHNMTMAEFVSQALDNELHPKFQMKEMNSMANTRTIAFQVPEELYQRIKDYLNRNNMTQKQFFLGLIESELEREQDEINARQFEEQQEEAAEEQPDYADGVPPFSDYGEASPEQYNEQYAEYAPDAPEDFEAQDLSLGM